MYNVTIQAETAAELRHKLINLTSVMLGEDPRVGPTPKTPQESPPESVEQINKDVGPLVTGVVPASKSKPAKKVSPRPPAAETEAIEVPPVEATEDELEPTDEELSPRDAVADEKTKAEVIRTLQSIYNSGKVQVIRHVLSKYGQGAKSFPEIEASRFPAIKEALARGEIA